MTSMIRSSRTDTAIVQRDAPLCRNTFVAPSRTAHPRIASDSGSITDVVMRSVVAMPASVSACSARAASARRSALR